MRQFCRSQHFFIRRILLADTDVFHHRIIEQRHILEYDGIQGHQCLRINGGDVHTAHGNLTFIDIPEPGSQSGHGGLTAAGRTNQRCHFALFCCEVHVFEHSILTVIGKAHMGKFDIIPLRIHGVGTGLDVMGQDLIQTVTLHTAADDGRQILQCHLQGIIHSGYQQQEYEEGQNIDLSPYQQHATGQRHGSDAQF